MQPCFFLKARFSGATLDVDTKLTRLGLLLHVFAHQQLPPRYPGGILLCAQTLDRRLLGCDPTRSYMLHANNVFAIFCEVEYC